MFSGTPRRVLDGLNRRYIYGRLVCRVLCSYILESLIPPLPGPYLATVPSTDSFTDRLSSHI
jgi:hypothetical protein